MEKCDRLPSGISFCHRDRYGPRINCRHLSPFLIKGPTFDAFIGILLTFLSRFFLVLRCRDDNSFRSDLMNFRCAFRFPREVGQRKAFSIGSYRKSLHFLKPTPPLNPLCNPYIAKFTIELTPPTKINQTETLLGVDKFNKLSGWPSKTNYEGSQNRSSTSRNRSKVAHLIDNFEGYLRMFCCPFGKVLDQIIQVW